MYRTVAVVNGGLEEVLQVAGFPEVFGRFRRYLQVVREVIKRFLSLPPSRRVCSFLGQVLWELGLAKLGFGNQVEPRSLRFGSTCAWPKQLKVLIEKPRLPPCASTIVARQALPP